MDPLPCAITIAWAEKDRILPVELCEAVVRDRLPGATFTVLPGLGHTPTIDDPRYRGVRWLMELHIDAKHAGLALAGVVSVCA
jgi:pimeloyl-ACP methyl ester carboxylesterase